MKTFYTNCLVGSTDTDDIGFACPEPGVGRQESQVWYQVSHTSLCLTVDGCPCHPSLIIATNIAEFSKPRVCVLIGLTASLATRLMVSSGRLAVLGVREVTLEK